MRRSIAVLTLAGLAALGAGSCTSSQRTTVTLVTHDFFTPSKTVLRAFTRQTGIAVKVLKQGDAGSALNQVILTKRHPLGDAMFGVDNTFLSRALTNGVFVPYRAPALAQVPAAFQLDGTHHLTPIDYGDVCVNADRKFFADRGLLLPQTLDDLTEPAYKGMLVTENAATSSPGLAFAFATVARYGPNGWLDYWRRLKANGVKVVDDWGTAYSTDFSGSSGKGPYPLAVSYASSPPAEVVDVHPQPAQSPTVALLDTCFRQVELVGVLKGAKHPAAARKLIDFMLSERFQADMPLQMYVYPVRQGTPLPPVFVEFAPTPSRPLSLPAAEIGAHRDEWIRQWTSTVLG